MDFDVWRLPRRAAGAALVASWFFGGCASEPEEIVEDFKDQTGFDFLACESSGFVFPDPGPECYETALASCTPVVLHEAVDCERFCDVGCSDTCTEVWHVAFPSDAGCEEHLFEYIEGSGCSGNTFMRHSRCMDGHCALLEEISL